MRKIKFLFAILIAVACLLTAFVVIASAEETGEAGNTITVSFVKSQNPTSTTTTLDKVAHADGKITVSAGEKFNLPTAADSTYFGQDGYVLVWYTENGRTYMAGEEVSFTEDTRLYRCVAKKVTTKDELQTALQNNSTAAILTANINATNRVGVKGEGESVIVMNGYNLNYSFSGSDNDALIGSQRSGKFIVGNGTITADDTKNKVGRCVVIQAQSHSHNGDRNKTVIGVDVTINAPEFRLLYDGDVARVQGYPWVKIYGKINVASLGYFSNQAWNSQPRIQIFEGAEVTTSMSSLICDVNNRNNPKLANNQSLHLTITGGKFNLPELATSLDYWTADLLTEYYHDYEKKTYGVNTLDPDCMDEFVITGGSFNVKLPDGLLKDGYQCVYNEETGYYDVRFVECTIENSNGVHNFVRADVYEECAPTCTKAGVYYFRCACGDYYVDGVDELGHSYDVLLSETPATCFAKAYKTYKCVRCDATTNVEYGNSLGHDYSIVKITKTATATENGKKLYICSRCDCYENGTHTDYDEANPSATCSHGCYYEDYSFSATDILIELVVKDGDTNKTVIVKVSDVYTITNGVFGAIKTFADPSDSTKTYNASSIVRLVIPTGVTSIPAGAIKNLSSLEEIYFQEGANATLAQKSIDSCANLKKIVAEGCTLVFEQYTVNSCANLATIDVSKANATFKSNAFKGYTAIKHLLLGSGQTYSFGEYAFGQSGLEEAIFPDNSNITFGKKSFAETKTITYIYIGKNIGAKRFADEGSLFGGNEILSKVVIMDAEYIGKWVFSCKPQSDANYKPKSDLYVYVHSETIGFASTGSFNNRNGNYKVYMYLAGEYTGSPFVGDNASNNPNLIIYKGIPHKYTEGGSQPTCTAQGSTAYTTDCPCGIVSDATYTVEAYSNYTGDKNPGTITVGEVTPALGHEFDPANGATVAETTPATCLNGGKITYKCANCDATSTADNPNDPQKEHNVEGVEFTVTVPVTCITDGLQIKLCKDCKLLAQSEVIPATGHNIEGVDWTAQVAPTCTLEGTNVKLCKTCGVAAEAQTVDALGHIPGELIQTLAPDCDENGLKEQHCTRCEVLIVTELVEKLGHEFDVSDGAVLFGMEYPNGFDKDGAIITKCARCAITSNTEVAPIFAAKGYSTNGTKTSIDGGYIVNTDLLALYESYNGAITYGVVIANANLFGENSFFNSENRVSIAQAIQVQINQKFYTNFNCTITNFGTHSSTLELVICAYVIDEDGNATFIQAENDYAVATTIGGQSFTKVTLDLVVANVAEQPDATTPPSNDEEN